VQQAPLPLHTWPLAQQVPLQHRVVQLVPGCPLVWLVYEQVLFVQVAVLHACAVQLPQLIVPSHPVGRGPQAPAGQVTIGWQQPLAVQTWLPVQQVFPLQQRCPVPLQFGPGWPSVTGV
jgi:hypothetical protein